MYTNTFEKQYATKNLEHNERKRDEQKSQVLQPTELFLSKLFNISNMRAILPIRKILFFLHSFIHESNPKQQQH